MTERSHAASASDESQIANAIMRSTAATLSQWLSRCQPVSSALQSCSTVPERADERELLTRRVAYVGRKLPRAEREPRAAHGEPEPVALAQEQVERGGGGRDELDDGSAEQHPRPAEGREEHVTELVEGQRDPREPRAVERIAHVPHPGVGKVRRERGPRHQGAAFAPRSRVDARVFEPITDAHCATDRTANLAPSLVGSPKAPSTARGLNGAHGPGYPLSPMKRILLVAVALAACSQPRGEAPLRDSAHAIQGGRPDTTSNFAVAVLGLGICSGTLIAPNLVLTARHCVETRVDESAAFCENGPLASAGDLYVSTLAELDLEGGPDPRSFVAVARVLPMPEVAPGCSPDQALVELAEPIAAASATPVRPAVEPAYLARPSFTPQVTAIGYGVDDVGSSGTRRIKEAIDVLCVHDDDAFECSGIPGITGEFEIVVGKGPCQGDSGGGLYDQESFTARDPVVVATVSRGGVDEQGVCDEGVYVRVDRFREFIIDAAIDAAARGGYEAPSWAVKDAPPKGRSRRRRPRRRA
jgi:hypothetical protein